MTVLRSTLIAMSACAVVSDAILIAFYPHFFERRYGVTSALHVGAYIAAISIAVMCTLPLWARVARRVETMQLLLVTQGAAGLLCALSWFADSVAGFWVLSLAMFMCKSSYLLMYPYLMRLEPAESHGHTIGLLSVVVYLGGIFGAVAGGAALQHLGPAACIGLMAAGDFAQMVMCAWLLRTGRVVRVAADDAVAALPPRPAAVRRRILQLCVLVMLFDFGAYLIRPFFSVHWERLSGSNDQLVSGLVFAIPAAMGLAALIANQRARRAGARLHDKVLPNLMLGAAGLLLQGAPHEAALLAGRLLYGWALFQLIVKFEVMLFRFSTPAAYARDFSVFNFFQNLGVVLSSFAAGALVERHGAGITFVLGAAGFVLTALLDRLFCRLDRVPARAPEPAAPSSLEATHAG